ncbi:hypothetical protein [Nocardioides sp.]|uniref:hypothetical protein n=1 Tax=Nocardioides sp. TaxID=35761 RepID=UPI00271F3552|nr:hypothetical protein [Nocardioides sp.]MDO9455218.1 hypothetical protein [Nocardioides sp.]
MPSFELLPEEQQFLDRILRQAAGSRSFGAKDEWLFDEVLDGVPQRSEDDSAQSGWLNACRTIALTAVSERCLAPRAADRALSRAWSLDNSPEAAIGTDDWVAAFRVVGFTCDPDEPFEQPTSPTQVWRGAPTERARGLAWTTDIHVAADFAGATAGASRGGVWTTVVPPQLVLARYNTRAEDEWVIDARELQLELYTPSI